jgi:hypothetical protein
MIIITIINISLEQDIRILNLEINPTIIFIRFAIISASMALRFKVQLACPITCRPWCRGTGSVLGTAAALGCASACVNVAAQMQAD